MPTEAIRKGEKGDFHTSGPPCFIRYLYVHAKDLVQNEVTRKKTNYTHFYKMYISCSNYFKVIAHTDQKEKGEEETVTHPELHSSSGTPMSE